MKKLLTFEYRVKNYEVRSCDANLLQTQGEHVTAEVVKWSGDSCMTLAKWERDNEGYFLKFVGDRPLKEDASILWTLFCTGQAYLDKHYLQE